MNRNTRSGFTSLTQELGDMTKDNWIRYVAREHNYPARPVVVGKFETREAALAAYPDGKIFLLGMFW